MEVIANPNFSVTEAEVGRLRDRAAKSPPVVARPLLLLSGYHSPKFPARAAAKHLRRFGACDPAQSLIVSYPYALSVEAAVIKATAAVAERGWMDREVDVVGVSMGGLVARVLAADHGLNVKRLFTLATPHRGAKMTERLAPDAAALQLMPGSEFLQRLDVSLALRTYELVCYAVLRDWMVGARNTAPIGMAPHWLDPVKPPMRLMSHFSISLDARIMADVALRLRGEAPISGTPVEPPRD